MTVEEKHDDQADFQLHSDSSSFNQKKDSIFGSLATLERKHEAYEKVRSHRDDREVMKRDPVLEPMIDSRRGGRGRGVGPQRGRGFRRPYVPEYRREPKKWTMYDLSDVSDSSMSERTTKAAALSFLSDLKKRKHTDDIDDAANDDHKEPGSSSEDTKVVFKKPKVTTKAETKPEESTSASSGKLVMPEFNFGTKKEKVKAKKTGSVAAGKGIQLSHLDDDEEEDGG